MGCGAGIESCDTAQVKADANLMADCIAGKGDKRAGAIGPHP